jgi:hypothetical protein
MARESISIDALRVIGQLQAASRKNMKLRLTVILLLIIFVQPSSVRAQGVYSVLSEKLESYRKAYNDPKNSNRELFRRYFSSSMKADFSHVNFEERFPSYILITIMRLPAEILEIKEMKIVDCGEKGGAPMSITKCLNMKGQNEAEVNRDITVRYIFEDSDWYIDSLAF